MTREEAKAEINKAFEPAFANYIITALTEGATPSEFRTSRWNLTEIHNCYEVYQCDECERKITVFHRFGDMPSVADVTVDYPYCHCGAKMEVDE